MSKITKKEIERLRRHTEELVEALQGEIRFLNGRIEEAESTVKLLKDLEQK